MIYYPFFIFYFFLTIGHEHGDASKDIVIDVDPEAVRRGMRSLMQQVAQIERERVCTKKKEKKKRKKNY